MGRCLRVAATLTGLGLARAAQAQGSATLPDAAVLLQGGATLPFDVPLLLIVAALAAWGLGLVAQRLGAPAALGEIGAGVALGALLPSAATAPGLDVLAAVGIAALLFAAGLDAARLEPRLRTPSAYALGAFAGSLLVVFGVLWAGVEGLRALGWAGAREAAVVALALAAGLVGMRAPSSRQPHLAALSTLPLLAGAFVLTSDPHTLATRVAGLTVLAVVVLLARTILGATQGSLRGLSRSVLLTVALLVAGFHALLAVACGLPAALGTGAAGFTLGRALRNTPVADALSDLTRLTAATITAPLLFALAGLRVPLHASALAAGAGLAIAAIAGRSLGIMAAGVGVRRPWSEALALALRLLPRGAVAVYLPLLALAAGALSPDLYAATIVAVAITLALDSFGRRVAARVEPEGAVLVGRANERTGVLVVGAGPLARRVATLLS
ncbi:MAG TPA: cation:proton antiporter, partial [Rhodothermales bacterium]|nr:cation:proton antiporter [Rhodothermales bacterium]